jgi:hypothetical protein
MNNQLEKIDQITILTQVVNSYNYNNFTQSFTITVPADSDYIKTADNLRKDAQRLVDKAISQYKIAQKEIQFRNKIEYEKQRLLQEIEIIKNKPESEWDATEKAKVKALNDEEYWNSHNYDYDDDYNDNEF